MRRWKLTLEYDGAGLVGWQRQDNGPSVQAALEAAAGRLDGRPVEVTGAGRTDAGVHARGQVAHLDLERALAPDRIRDGLNFWLREAAVLGIVVLAAAPAPDAFHARFSATRRHYLYRILNRRAPAALERERAWVVARPLDAGAMAAAATLLVGRHDFSTFRAAECQAASPVKTLDFLGVTRSGEEIAVAATARSFLHHQVRNMVGTLKLVGERRWSLDRFSAAFAARDRAKGGPTAPAHGLYLMGVDYDEG